MKREANNPAQLRKAISSFLKEHWKEILGFIVGGVTSVWITFLPLPSDLLARGTLLWLVLSVVAVLLVAVHFVKLQMRSPQDRLRPAICWLLLTLIGFVLVGPFLFYQVDDWWKRPNVSSSLVYNWLEPLVYGLTFAFLTALVAYVALLVSVLIELGTKPANLK